MPTTPSQDTACCPRSHHPPRTNGISESPALAKKFVRATLEPVIDVQVIEDPEAAAVALDPIRSRLLAELAEPSSAAALAARVGLPRQKVNYHLRGLERQKLVRPAAERRWGGLTERVMVATATSYVVSPAALRRPRADPARRRA